MSPKNGSCVRCGIVKAIEALETSSQSSMGGTVILISQGKSTSLALDEEERLSDLTEKHKMAIFSLAIPRQPQNDISLSLERLSHRSGGQSYFIPENSYDGREVELSTYVAMVDALSEIRSRTNPNGPFLVSNSYFFKLFKYRLILYKILKSFS